MIELDTLTDKEITLCTKLINDQQYDLFLQEIEEMPYADVAEAIEESDNPIEVMKKILEHSEMKAGRICSYLGEATQLEIFEQFPDAEFARIFINMEPDIRVDLFQLIPEDDRKKFLRLLDNKTVGNLFLLDSYDPDSAGGIMSTDYQSVRSTMTVQQVIQELKNMEHRTHNLYHIYVIDEERVLLGRVSIRELLFAERDEVISNILKDIVTAAHVDEDQEDVVKKFEKYDVYHLPVINDKSQLVGQISSDDIIDVIREEETEDYEKLMGISQGEHELPYLESSTYSQFKKRVFWLLGLTLVGFCSGMVVRHFDNALDRYIVLAIFMPMIAATGGNVGSQASSVIIRALALDEISASDWPKVLYKELKVALLIALTLGVMAFAGVFILSHGLHIPEGRHLMRIAETIGIALFLQIISAILFGTGFPLMVKMLKGDPAVVASPAITTFVDITGLLIYFTTATIILLN